MNSKRIGFWQLDWDWDGEGLESESGDLHLIAPFDNGVLIATLDGLGHGAEAAEASRKAAEYLSEHRRKPLDSLLHGCHTYIRDTRGVALSAVSFNAAECTLTWAGIGNVETALFSHLSERNPEVLLTQGGVVGFQMPSARISRQLVRDRDLLVMATDGINSDFVSMVNTAHSPTQVAADIFTHHAKGNDDALALVVRFLEVSDAH